MADVYVAAGSNVDPLRNLAKAVALLKAAHPSLRVSAAYQNKAVGFEGEDFVNLVVAFATDATPPQVREQLQRVETACGRAPDAAKWAPRSMDLDILLFGDRISDEPGLVFPRPDLVRRAYMLKPMVDLAPDLVHPTLHKSMRELWEAFDQQGHEMKVVELPE